MANKNEALVEQIVDEYRDIKEKLDELQRDYAEVFRDQAQYRRRLQELHQLARYAAGDDECPIHGLHHRKKSSAGTTADCIAEALLKIDGPAKLEAIVDAMLDLEWETSSDNPNAVVRSALHRMEKQNKVLKDKNGSYSLNDNPT